MIDRNEIDRMSEEMSVNTSNVQRDYVHGWILSLLYSKSPLSNLLTLKGGNALRKGYFEQTRFSRDIDFTTTGKIYEEKLAREFNEICKALAERSGVIFDTEKTLVKRKRGADEDKDISEVRLYFSDFYGKPSEIILGVRLDVTQFDRLYLPIQKRNLIHPYSDADSCSTLIRCVQLEEILATKMRCLLQRKHIADLFDLAYATIIAPEIKIDRRALISTFYKITTFRRQPSVVKGLFFDLPLETLSHVWKKYIACPIAAFFDFEHAKDTFISLVDDLIPGNATHDHSRTFFPSALRNPILAAADTLTMLKLTYSNIERLVEPYELAFKIRKDGVAREYLYAYDTTGGRSAQLGIKTFLPGKVQSLENTDKKFEPRMPVELSKAGGSETVSHFTGKRGRRPASRSKSISRISKNTQRGWNAFHSNFKIRCPYLWKNIQKKAVWRYKSEFPQR